MLAADSCMGGRTVLPPLSGDLAGFRTSLYIKRGKVSVRNVLTSVTVGLASSVANDVIMRL